MLKSSLFCLQYLTCSLWISFLFLFCCADRKRARKHRCSCSERTDNTSSRRCRNSPTNSRVAQCTGVVLFSPSHSMQQTCLQPQATSKDGEEMCECLHEWGKMVRRCVSACVSEQSFSFFFIPCRIFYFVLTFSVSLDSLNWVDI